MRLTTLAMSGLIALLGTGVARGQTTTGFPPLPPVPKTGELPANPSATKFTFIVAGDNRPQAKTPSQPKTLSQILSDAQRFKPAFFLWCGDTISGHITAGHELHKQYKAFITIASTANVPIFNAPGNHEMDLEVKQGKNKVEIPNEQMFRFYLAYMQPPNSPSYAYGAFNYGNSRFIAMNTEEVAPKDLPRSPGRVVASGLKLDPGYVGADQIAMLKQDLAANQDKDHIFVFMHHPIQPSNPASGLDRTTATTLEKIFESNSKISYVLAAHEHLYFNASGPNKTPPTWKAGAAPIYLVTGGAGAPLDKCGSSRPNTYCQVFNHYLVFTVDGPNVSVQVISVKESKKKSTKKNGGKK
jgi:calcineurin-like phosphoesterase family protein